MSYKKFFNNLRAPVISPDPLPISRSRNYSFHLKHLDESKNKAPKSFYEHLRRFVYDSYQRCRSALLQPDDVSSPEAHQFAVDELGETTVTVQLTSVYPSNTFVVHLTVYSSGVFWNFVCPLHCPKIIAVTIPGNCHGRYYNAMTNPLDLLSVFVRSSLLWYPKFPTHCSIPLDEARHPGREALIQPALLRFGYHALPKLLSPENMKFREALTTHYLRKTL